MKKAQMSLEMIIGLLILLVVAVVVIRMFLSNIGGIDKPQKDIDQVLIEMNFKSNCENLCNQYLSGGSQATLAKYCYTQMLGDPDLNRNGKIDAFQSYTKVLDVCEDRLYCFHIIPCKTEAGNIDWDDCRQIVCQAYYNVYKDWAKADEKVYELFPNVGTCEINDDENWWVMYFGSNPCTDPGQPPSEEEEFSLSLGACTIQSSNWSFSCVINSMTGECENGLAMVWSDNPTRIASAVHGVDNYGVINFGTTFSGSVDLTNDGLQNYDFTDNPPQNPCFFSYKCDINLDNNPEDPEDLIVFSSSCQIV